MAIQYGKTWWGQQWLNSLSKIDNSNRLPRGKTYANKGAVKNIEIEGNTIAAKVQGSAPRPYKVAVSVPIFTDKQKKNLLEEILSDPSLLAKLLNRELPQELAKAADRNSIPLFPKSWRDFPMKCSCPDYAVPCKHLAAVIYIIANEIDKNPFLIFQLHGFDVLAEVSSRYSIGTKSGIRVNKFRDFFEEKPKKSSFVTENIFQHLDFSVLEPLSDKLLKIIQANPIFYEKDFKKNLEKAHKLFNKGAKNWQIEEKSQSIKNFHLGDSLIISVKDTSEIKEFIFTTTDENTLRAYEKVSFEKLLNTLLLTDDKYFERMSDGLRALKICHQFCLKLLENGAVIPQLLASQEEAYFIRWLPAVNNAAVQNLLTAFSKTLPPAFIQYQGKNKTFVQTQEEQALTLCSLILGHYIRLFTVSMGEVYRGKVSFEMWDEFFFQGVPYEFKGFREKETPTAIQSWLNNYYITQKDFVPILRVEENEEKGTFLMDILVEDRRRQDAPIEFLKILEQKKYESIRFEVLQDILLLANHFQPLEAYIKGQKKMSFDSEEFVSVLLEILPVLQLFGIQILLPKSLKHWIKPQISGTLKTSGSKVNVSSMNLQEILSFDWQIAVGEELLSWDAFEKLIRGMKGLVKIKDRFVLIEQSELEKLKKQLENPPKLTGSDLLKTALSEEFQGTKVGLSPEVLALLKDLTNPSSVKLPNNLLADLRPYQLRGYEWMSKNAQLGFGSLIADDMGLGKTLQVIALLLKFKQNGAFEKQKALVVVPTTLLTNWQKEISRFAPDLSFSIYHGSKRKMELKESDVLLTTYGLVRSDADIFKKLHWHCIVIDEAQNIKNPETEQTKAVKNLKADIRIAMSGTPVENRLSEFWSILDFANKGYLGNLSKFTNEFTKPIQLDHNQEKLDVFKKITAPFLLRRVKTDKSIISDLPDKIENNQYISLSKEQAALYESVVQQIMKDIEENEGIARKGLVLKLMTALKQVGNHPYQYLGKGKKLLEESGKAQALIELLENIQEVNEKVLIFTQYREMGNLLVEFIQEKFGTEPLFLHGGVDRKQRDVLVERFQKNREDNIFILSLKAGGTGLNLTQGNHVIHYDLWWNPAVENQATDRAFRIGQTKNVMVYRLINQGTMEEKIDEMIRSKKDLADMSITTGETWLGDLSNDDLKKLVKLTKM